MDIRRIERFIREIITAEALPFALVAVNQDESHRIDIVVRAGDGRTFTIHTANAVTPVTLRQLVRERLEAEI
jgi:hypothetical protein